MIKIPVCFFCQHYNNGVCLAYPDEIPEEVLFSKNMAEKECGNGIKFEERKSFSKVDLEG